MAGGGSWELEFYQDENGREPCRSWIRELSRESVWPLKLRWNMYWP